MTTDFGTSHAAVLAPRHSTNKIIAASAYNTSSTLQNTQITSRTKSKWQQGFLGGYGSTSQFQSANSMLPVMPANSNSDTVQRVLSVEGVAGPPIYASWQRNYAFAPGRGLDAARSKITWTDDQAGRDQTTGVVAPLVNAGVDRFGAGPTPPLQTYQLGNGNTQAPVVITGGEGPTATERIIQARRVADRKRQKGPR